MNPPSQEVTQAGRQIVPPIAAGQIANAIGNNVNSLNTL
jgi:hypothetical protein